MSECWLIETAPHWTSTLRSVLLYWESSGWSQGYFHVDDMYSSRPVGWVSPECGWIGFGDACIPINQPTHWMPLPEAPK